MRDLTRKPGMEGWSDDQIAEFNKEFPNRSPAELDVEHWEFSELFQKRVVKPLREAGTSPADILEEYEKARQKVDTELFDAGAVKAYAQMVIRRAMHQIDRNGLLHEN